MKWVFETCVHFGQQLFCWEMGFVSKLKKNNNDCAGYEKSQNKSNLKSLGKTTKYSCRIRSHGNSIFPFKWKAVQIKK